MATIVIDPGHGGTTNVGGSSANHAKGPSGLLEKTATLDVAKRVATALRGSGHKVVLSRTGDTNLGLTDRARVAKTEKAPVFVSIHFNGFDKHTQGTETFCHTDHRPDSADLCRSVQAATVAATSLSDRNKGHPNGVKTMALGVLKRGSHHATTACVLVEVSFMDVPAEDTRLQTAAYKNRVAKGLADGIAHYLRAASLESAPVRTAQLEDGFEALHIGVQTEAARMSARPKPRAAKAAKGARKARGRGRSAEPAAPASSSA